MSNPRSSWSRSLTRAATLVTPFVLSLAAQAAPKPTPQMKAILQQLESLKPKPLATLSAEEARKQPTLGDATKKLLATLGVPANPQPVAQVAETAVSGAEGTIPARIYKPAAAAPQPVIVYFHGGGFVVATNDTYDATARALASSTGAIVVSIEYRKAPEHKFPAAHDDAFAAYQWVLANAASLGGDAKRVAVAGESAGGNLAINVAIRARDAKVAMPVAQLLIYPIAGTDLTTPSYRDNLDAKPLDPTMMAWFFAQALKSPSEMKDPRLNVVDADLHGLPPTTIITAQIDPLRSEDETLASRLQSRGVQVRLQNYDGVTHEFFGLSAVLDEAKAAQALAAEELKKAFAQH